MAETEWITMEQQFQHARAMQAAERLDKKALLEVLGKVHRLKLFYERAFNQYLKYSSQQGLFPPPLSELLGPNSVETTNPLDKEHT